MESMMLSWLCDVGFHFARLPENGTQLGFQTASGKIQGHVDGIITDGPREYAYPFLWENKALGHRSWKNLVKKTVTLANPAYATQIALYQAYLDLHHNPALLTAINADTMELYVEWIPFQGDLAQRASDRGVHIVRANNANEWLPRISYDPSYFECKRCPWKTRCWEASPDGQNQLA